MSQWAHNNPELCNAGYTQLDHVTGDYDPDAISPDVGLCIVCGENWCEDTRCERCKRNLEEDRLNREQGL